jgi:hypothetical protein
MVATGLVILAVGAGACSENPVSPDGDTQLALVVPAGGSIGVDPGGNVTVDFSHSLMAGMEEYMVVHEGDVTGPLVPGSWSWSGNRTHAVWTPASFLKANTTYMLHLGGGMLDGEGHEVGFSQHGSGMGGQWATAAMMGNGMAGSTGSMMGTGWRHADGTYGMVFRFTTR